MAASVQTPSSPPFTSLGDTRLELRLHNWSMPAANAVIFQNAGFTVLLRTSGELCVSDDMDSLRAWGGSMCADINGRPDVTIRAQRDTANKLLRYEARGTAGDWRAVTYCGTLQNGNSYRNTFPCPIDSLTLNSWAGTGTMGSALANVRVSWVKWYSSLVPDGSGLLGETAPADLADWRFEGDMANQGTGGYAVSMGPLVAQGAVGPAGGVIYMPSPSLAPACVAGRQHTFHAGFAGQLDGSQSYPLDGGDTIAYSWRQLSGPSTATLSDAAAPQPSISGLIFGSYVFQLTVTDGRGITNTCTVKHGAVASDDNGVVITNNPAADTLLGPLIRFEANPWPWFDDRHKAEADMQAASMDLYYGAYWDPASPAYGSDAAETAWLYSPAPANYYDNVAAFYALYYRSGIDDYLAAARNLADRFWASPKVNAGASCDIWGNAWNCYPARSLSVQGLVLRALDGRPDMWAGLHIIFTTYRTYYLDLADRQWGIWDTREMAYHLAVVSYCALYDIDATYRQDCKASLSKALASTWTPARAADGSFPALYVKTSSWDTGTSVALAHGSATVTGLGVNWNASLFQCPNASGQSYPCQIWFTNNPAGRPAGNADGDPVVYTATFVDATHFTLDRPYEGTTGAHGWALPDPNAGLLGFGAQPFIEGLLGFAFDMAGRAIADSDPVNSALARNYNVGIANWLRTTGYWANSKGMYYGAGFANCQAPISDNNIFCTGGNDAPNARTLNAEAMRSVMTAYAYSSDVALKSFADTLYSAMFSKPGTNGPNPDGIYIGGLDDGTGWYMLGAPPIGKAPKYFGMFFGIGGLSAWPAYRAGGAPSGTTTVLLAPDTMRFPAVRRVRAITTAPSGASSTSECAARQCTLEVDPRQGAHLVKLEYLSADGKLLREEQTTVRAENIF